MRAKLSEAVRIYSKAARYCSRTGLDQEVQFQRDANFEIFTETDLLRESAWVILCSGFRESTVRRLFDYISLCFCDWESAKAIVDADPACRLAAIKGFGNSRKVDAIANVAFTIVQLGFDSMKWAIHSNPIDGLQRFPFIGKVTSYHLAKNLGLDVAKPDRHLVRLASRIGFESAHELCESIARSVGESTRVVDLVLWRYLADAPQIGLRKGADSDQQKLHDDVTGT